MTENQQLVATDVINMVASVINSTSPAPVTSDWDSIISFAREQRILNIVAYAAENLQTKPEPQIMKYLREFKMKRMLMEATQEIEFTDAMDRLEEMKIRHMPLKGYIVKNLYPSPDMRTMSDLDLLIDADKVDETIKDFAAHGYDYAGEGDLHTNVQRAGAYIEFHHCLVNETYKRLSEYYADGFSKAVKYDNCEYRYRMTDNDLYIFLVIHLAKHFHYGGTGIRTVLDLYVYEKQCPQLDFDYISAELNKLGAGPFFEMMRKLAFKWFDGSFDGTYDIVSGYIISGGVYGKSENIIQNKFIAHNIEENIGKAQKRNLIKTVFPPIDIMSINYPILKKVKILLPLMWIVRLVTSVFQKPENVKGRIKVTKNISNIDEELVEIQKAANLTDTFK